MGAATGSKPRSACDIHHRRGKRTTVFALSPEPRKKRGRFSIAGSGAPPYPPCRRMIGREGRARHDPDRRRSAAKRSRPPKAKARLCPARWCRRERSPCRRQALGRPDPPNARRWRSAPRRKRFVYQSLDAPRPLEHAAMTRTYPAAEANIASQDYIEGPKAFAERRKPNWQNRSRAGRRPPSAPASAKESAGRRILPCLSSPAAFDFCYSKQHTISNPLPRRHLP